MTVRYATRTGVYTVVRPHAKWGLPLRERTLAKALREAGDTTAIVGKWKLVSHSATPNNGQGQPKARAKKQRKRDSEPVELGVPIVDASYAYIRYIGDQPTAERLESLFAKDRAHPGLWGSYLCACMIYSALTDRSPLGLAAPDAIPQDVAKALQEAAWAQHRETATALKK